MSNFQGSICAYDFEDFQETLQRGKKNPKEWRYVKYASSLRNFNLDERLWVTHKFRTRTDPEAKRIARQIDRIVKAKHNRDES